MSRREKEVQLTEELSRRLTAKCHEKSKKSKKRNADYATAPGPKIVTAVQAAARQGMNTMIDDFKAALKAVGFPPMPTDSSAKNFEAIRDNTMQSIETALRSTGTSLGPDTGVPITPKKNAAAGSSQEGQRRTGSALALSPLKSKDLPDASQPAQSRSVGDANKTAVDEDPMEVKGFQTERHWRVGNDPSELVPQYPAQAEGGSRSSIDVASANHAAAGPELSGESKADKMQGDHADSLQDTAEDQET